MNNSISGKEALIALANGEEVEWRHSDRDWFKAPQCGMRTQDFFSGVYRFRLKPRTITINGIEVSKPQKNMPEKGDEVFTLDFTRYEGYVSWTCQSSINTFDRDWWKSEDEIKQVVAALRQVFGEV